ncbi:hypothetical protein PIB40_00660 [Bifidobacterium longum]|uniref:hypothetical protein n=1 Tax=Bifidobacterium longum TaxID=216816 RepID=UPI002306E6FC|nr:hypothetical protein [Bifidobacterium longum]WCE37493.1 hypothetical protein PIB40_00660 [Bifidobacterium longum]
MEEYEINELRGRLDNMEFRLDGLSADIEKLTRRLDESGRRDRDFQRAMWIQTDAGQRYRHWMDTWQPIWNEFLTLREVTERERRRHALEATRAAGFEHKPKWEDYRAKEKNPIKRMLGFTPVRGEYEEDLRRWQETYDAAIKPLPHAAFFVEGGRSVVKQVEDTYKAVKTALEDGHYVTVTELIDAPMPSFEYRYDAQVPDALPGVAKWLREHRK